MGHSEAHTYVNKYLPWLFILLISNLCLSLYSWSSTFPWPVYSGLYRASTCHRRPSSDVIIDGPSAEEDGPAQSMDGRL